MASCTQKQSFVIFKHGFEHLSICFSKTDGINMSHRYQETVLMRNMRKNKQIAPQKHQTKQDVSGKIVIHEIKIADIYS